MTGRCAGARGARRTVRLLAKAQAFGPKARCREASSAPAASTPALQARPLSRPPGPSATQPTRLGPTICPAAKMMVNAAMPAGQAVYCRANGTANTERG